MAEHPILMSGSMVRATMENRKNQTRRVIVPQPVLLEANGRRSSYAWRGGIFALDFYPDRSTILEHCPHGSPGDLLWVRESAMLRSIGPECEEISLTYRADETVRTLFREDRGPFCSTHWTPSIHMPRWACRLTLRLLEVRVQRLQEITDGDIAAEGIEWGWNGTLGNKHGSPARDAFVSVWDPLNARRGYSWQSNPWVWALRFERTGASRG